jgi:hypothetical protein
MGLWDGHEEEPEEDEVHRVTLLGVDLFDFAMWAEWAAQVEKLGEGDGKTPPLPLGPLAEKGADGAHSVATEPKTMEIDTRDNLTIPERRMHLEELVHAWLFGHAYFLSDFQNYTMRCLVYHVRKLIGFSVARPRHHSAIRPGSFYAACESGTPLFDGFLLKEIWEKTTPASAWGPKHSASGAPLRNFVYAAMVESYNQQPVPRSVWSAIFDWPGEHHGQGLWESRWMKEDDPWNYLCDTKTFVNEVAPQFFVDVEAQKVALQLLFSRDKNAAWQLAEKLMHLRKKKAKGLESATGSPSPESYGEEEEADDEEAIMDRSGSQTSESYGQQDSGAVDNEYEEYLDNLDGHDQNEGFVRIDALVDSSADGDILDEIQREYEEYAGIGYDEEDDDPE